MSGPGRAGDTMNRDSSHPLNPLPRLRFPSLPRLCRGRVVPSSTYPAWDIHEQVAYSAGIGDIFSSIH
jgi:hypothetical protein